MIQGMVFFAEKIDVNMNQLQKYTWLIETIRRAGRISHKELSDKWERNKNLSDSKPLARATFNRWREAILDQFNIDIECQKTGGYLYFIANQEEIGNDELKKWMLDSFAVGNMIGDNMSLKGRILVKEIPSGWHHLTTMLEAMKENRVVNMTYCCFGKSQGDTFTIKPYCVKLFDNRWYVYALNNLGKMRLYGLDRVESAEVTDETFKLPEDFDAARYFSDAYGVVLDSDVKTEEIWLRAYKGHKHYLNTLPIHHSQELIEDCGEYADFKLTLSPTYDFVMRLLQMGSMVEVIKPAHLRDTMKGWIAEMNEIYKND